MRTFDPSDYLHKHKMVAVLTDKKTSLHKHKMGARDSMLGYLISNCFLLVLDYITRRTLILGNQKNSSVNKLWRNHMKIVDKFQ